MIEHEKVHDHFEIWNLDRELLKLCRLHLATVPSDGRAVASIETPRDQETWHSNGHGFATMSHSSKVEAVKRAEWIAVSIAKMSLLTATLTRV